MTRPRSFAACSVLALWLAACGSETDFDAGGADGGARDAGGASDAGASDAGASDAGASDAGASDAGALDAGAMDAGELDAGAMDAGELDAGELDAGAMDAGELDAGPPPPRVCAGDGDCTTGLCLAGVCRVVTETTHSEEGLGSIRRMVAGTDRDGTLRLLTDTGTRTYDVVGAPGAFGVTAGGAATDVYPLRGGGRQGTASSHASYTAPAYRWVVVDQRATVNEDRVIEYQTTAHAPDGTLYVLTLPRYPRGPSDLIDVFPLRVWSPGPSGYEREDLTRTVGTRRDFHLRVDASGQFEVMETDAFRVFRWHLELAGWERSIEHTFEPVATRDGPSRWVNDAAGHTHLVRVLPTGAATDALTYVELDDTGVVRSRRLTFGDGHVVSSQVGFDDDGHVYFLSVGTVTSPNRRPYYLHRVRAEGGDDRTLLGTLRTDFGEALALAVRPDGDVFVFVFSPTRDMVVRALAIGR
ncbi:MAG: hypothetical protein KF729_02565 [Sandaracinaceae bacterium]|nr:hypothetical protein [Sandaracinaceae bacterium]